MSDADPFDEAVRLRAEFERERERAVVDIQNKIAALQERLRSLQEPVHPRPRRAAHVCRLCGATGHNARRCPKRKDGDRTPTAVPAATFSR